MIGNIPDRDMAMLEERIKRTSKSRPPPGSSAPPAPVQAAPEPMAPPQQPTGLPRPGNRNIPSAGGASNLRMRYQQQQPQQQSGQPAESRLPQQRTSPGSRIGSGRDRPISGAFTLDLDKIESGGMDGSIHAPQLVNHNLDGIFNEEPVVLPPTLANRGGSSSSGSHHRMDHRNFPPSPVSGAVTSPTVPLSENSEALEALDVILAQVFNKDAAACVEALGALDEFIKDEEKVQMLSTRMDQLLTACYMQYRHVLNNKLRTDNAAANAKVVMRLFQYLTMVLMSTYHHAELTRSASTSALHDLFHVIISILLEPKMEQLADGAQLLRALNVLTVKIIDRSDHTNITSAIVKLLSDAVANASLNPKFSETVMKCMWKIIRLLPQWMEDEAGPLDVDLVLSDLHDFLKTYPQAYWKRQESDTPLRTVKTVIHAMVKVRGDAILDNLSRINDPTNSELVAYLEKLVKSGIGKENANDIMKNGNSTTTKSSTSSSGGKIPRFTKSDHDALAEIFKKIGQKELTKQGLQELYNFKQQNPHADLEPFLVKSSDYFRNYIERGLKSIEAEANNANGGSHATAANSRVLADSNIENHDAGSGAAPHQLYLERLKKLRAQGGLDRASSASSGIGTGSSQSSVYRIAATSSTVESYSSSSTRSNYTVSSEAETESTSSSSTLTAGSTGQPDVDAIRRRLERIKASGSAVM